MPSEFPSEPYDPSEAATKRLVRDATVGSEAWPERSKLHDKTVDAVLKITLAESGEFAEAPTDVLEQRLPVLWLPGSPLTVVVQPLAELVKSLAEMQLGRRLAIAGSRERVKETVDSRLTRVDTGISHVQQHHAHARDGAGAHR